ncbi:MAG: AEC family transporter, partial [Clostridia bacterium]|nr:AEC family transporter [Clostridia bacterium]
MQSFIFALNAVLPILFTVATGYVLKRLGFMNPEFCKRSNRIIFRCFLPCLLFLNIYKMDAFGNMGGFILYGVVALFAVFFFGIFASSLVTDNGARRGVIVQGTFRSNYALVGIPLAGLLFGDEGVVAATLMSSISVPMLNIFAVISLTVFNKKDGKVKIGDILRDIVKNPLLQGILAGVVFVFVRGIFEANDIGFRLSNIQPV